MWFSIIATTVSTSSKTPPLSIFITMVQVVQAIQARVYLTIEPPLDACRVCTLAGSLWSAASSNA